MEAMCFHGLSDLAQGFALVYEQHLDPASVLLPRTRRYPWRIGFGVSRHCKKTTRTGLEWTAEKDLTETLKGEGYIWKAIYISAFLRTNQSDKTWNASRRRRCRFESLHIIRQSTKPGITVEKREPASVSSTHRR